MRCNVCCSPLAEPIYSAKSDQAITSLCESTPGKVQVWLCPNCGHLCGKALPHTTEYYDNEYRINLSDEEEDQIYAVETDRIIYRTEHQVATLAGKLVMPEGARLLDYGCAKASTPRRLIDTRPDLDVHLFDVSGMYLEYWRQFLSENRWAVYETPTAWSGSFNIVTSFFALEHIPDPINTVKEIEGLLAEDGVFYGIVPDTFGNIADFVVIDHVNHFTDCSLHFLLSAAGFVDIEIDSDVHRGALVFTARKIGSATKPPDLKYRLESSRDLAAYWSRFDSYVKIAEAKHFGVASAIYGSGFYGAYIASALQRPEALDCFLDASPFQQEKVLFGKRILAPESLPEHVQLLYVGLNPAIARQTFAEMSWLEKYDLTLVFMDGED